MSAPVIKVEARTIYGVKKYAPASAAAAHLAAIAGTSTLTIATLQRAQLMGLEVVEVWSEAGVEKPIELPPWPAGWAVTE